MAIKHLSFKKGLAGYGLAHASYIRGQGAYASRDDVVHVVDFNLPSWAESGQDFFSAADTYERANGRAYLELEFSIPRETNDPVAFAHKFADQQLSSRFVYSLAVHDRSASDGGRNIHAHLMFSDRQLDGIERLADQFFRRANGKQPERGGCKKDRAWNDRQRVKLVRDQYAEFVRTECAIADFNMDASPNPEPKIGPDMKRVPVWFGKRRADTLARVQEMRITRKSRKNMGNHTPQEEGIDRTARMQALRQQMGLAAQPSFNSIRNNSGQRGKLSNDKSIDYEIESSPGR